MMKLLIALAALFAFCAIIAKIKANKTEKEEMKQLIKELNEKVETFEKKQHKYSYIENKTDNDNTLKESEDDDVPYYFKGKLDPEEMESFGRELEMSLFRAPSPRHMTKEDAEEIKELLSQPAANKKNIKIPWFAVGIMLSKASNARSAKIRENVEKIKKGLR